MDATDIDFTVTAMLSSLKMDDNSVALPSIKPPLPPKKETFNVFHVYKDQLARLPVSALPAEFIVTDKNHSRILLDVLHNHPNAEKKIGAGIKYVFVRRSQTRKGLDVCCCYIKRIDDTEEDFSLFKAYGTLSRKNKNNSKFDSKDNEVIDGNET